MGAARNPILTVVGCISAVSAALLIALAVSAQPAPEPSVAALAGAGSPAPPNFVVVSEVSQVVDPVPTTSPMPARVDDPPVLSPSHPVAIDIPTISVQSELQHLGLTAEHTLEVPAPGPHYNEAAWYKYSATPGAPGPAVILGHVDSAADGPSVFFSLRELQPQDQILVTRADGVVAVFEVDSIGRYPKVEFPTELVYGNTDHAALRLITCGGEFDEADGHYLDNIVVFASLVGARNHGPESAVLPVYE